MKRFLPVALVIALTVLGCGTKDNAVAPKLQTSQGDIHYRSYPIFYNTCGTFIGSYSNDFVGPIPYGYCRQNGTGMPEGCDVGTLSWRLGYIDPQTGYVVLKGDPDADTIGDPDTPDLRTNGDPTSDDSNAADTDGSVIK